MDVGASNCRLRAPVGVRRLMAPPGWTAGALKHGGTHTDAHKSRSCAPQIPEHAKCAAGGAEERHDSRLGVRGGHLEGPMVCPGRYDVAGAMPPPRDGEVAFHCSARGTTPLDLRVAQGRRPQVRSLSNFSNFLANSSALDLYLKPQPLPASFQSIPTHWDVVKRNRAYSAVAKWAPFRARRGSGSRIWRQLERPSRLWIALTCTNWVGVHVYDGECIYIESCYSGTEALGGACRAASQEQGPASATKSPMGSELSMNGRGSPPTL